MRPALAVAARLISVVVIVVALCGPVRTSSVALATHTLTGTPTGAPPTTYPMPPHRPDPYNPWAGTPTVTPTVYGQGQPAPGQTSPYGVPIPAANGGSSVQPAAGGTLVEAYPGGPGQQSVPGAPYPGAPISGAVPPPGGMPGSVVSSGAAPAPGGSDICYGDEMITFSPESPRIGNEFLIAVTSSRPHPYGRLAGTEAATFVRERPGQRGYVWEWTVQPSYPGQHEYTFYVDSTVPCQKVQLRVQQSLATRTPTPTKTATPWGGDNGNSNNNNNSNNNSNNNDNFSNGTAPVVDPSMYVSSGQDIYGCGAFQSQSNAQRVLRWDPSDPNRLDSEDSVTDGIACLTFNYSAYPNDRDMMPVTTFSATATPGVFDPSTYLGQGDRYGCKDFTSQANAQAVLRADPSDPNRLDTTPRDGLACGGSEASQDGVAGGFMPPPYDATRVAR